MSLETAIASTAVTLAAVVVLIGIGITIGGLYFWNQLQMPLVRLCGQRQFTTRVCLKKAGGATACSCVQKPLEIG